MNNKFCKNAMVLSALLTACNNPAIVESELAGFDCTAIDGVETLLTDIDPQIIVIGEIHGMDGPPAFAEALMCHSLSRGLKTGLALEYGDEEGRYTSYLASPGSAADQIEFFEESSWKYDFTDGRSSEAMLSLIDRAREYKNQGHDLTVITFRPEYMDRDDYLDRNTFSQAFEEESAKNILAGSANLEKTIVLVGNLHARRGNFKYKDKNYEHMAEHLPAPQTLTFNAVYTAGTSWSCMGPTAADCKEYESGATVDTTSGLLDTGRFAVLIGNGRESLTGVSTHSYAPDKYDGVVYTGPAKASPPANKNGRVPYEDDQE